MFHSLLLAITCGLLVVDEWRNVSYTQAYDTSQVFRLDWELAYL